MCVNVRVIRHKPRPISRARTRECWFSLQGIIHHFRCSAVSALPACLSGVSVQGRSAAAHTLGAAEWAREGSRAVVCYQERRRAGQGEADLRSALQPAASTNSQFCTSPRRVRLSTHEQITQTPWPPTEPPSLDSPLRLRERYFSAFQLIKNYKQSAFCNLDENIWHLVKTQAQIPANSICELFNFF